MGTGRIVVGVDGSDESKAALRWAARQAEATGAWLEPITAWDIPVTFGVPVYEEEIDLSDSAGATLSATAEEVLGPDPAMVVTPVVVRGHPARALVEASVGAELLVVGSRGRGGFLGALLGSTSTYCVHHAKCPIVVLRAEEDEDPPVEKGDPAV
ncbi:universal stress protein [Thermomonospora umbrina]|uniref:Nucleotide-binding universal stress UspA family protein n=1 Tax=Thermomonospora umbrina TaxID=111806 RepID=A0A3D9SRX8_9ACTN|nr:universal stress protein [Thermomonospora umbrina]REE98692.1 nucleotide-binding universal stress UspA family protein [Thermomonospora umbrina]